MGLGLVCALGAAGLATTRTGRADSPTGRYTISSDTVVDNTTSLSWQAVPAATTYVWTDAVTYCQGLNLGGSSSWRVPTIGELETLVDDSRTVPAIDPKAFANTATDSDYWTSSTVSGFGSTYAYGVNFQNGGSIFHFGMNYLHVRCVSSSP